MKSPMAGPGGAVHEALHAIVFGAPIAMPRLAPDRASCHICHMRWIILVVLCALAVACTRFPELEASVSPAVEDAPYPDLVPVEPIIATSLPREETRQTEQSVQARVDALRRRAARLRGRVVDSETRARMRQGISEG